MNNVQVLDFNIVYPRINSYILNMGIKSTSRNGEVKKVREFVTRLSDPNKNLVGGWGRRINPFFLFVESIWIWCGKNDVETLLPFNCRMVDYSDNGKSFHAAYGHRLRKYHRGVDQVSEAIRLLEKDIHSRRIVIHIWNAPDDLGADTKDVPCNDMITVSIDENRKLRFSIFNRSNDLHWGLPTNIYQFSTLGKLMANCLGLQYGNQTHFSNDLHIYASNPIAEKMESYYNDFAGIFDGFNTIYDYCVPTDINFKFENDSQHNDALQRLNYIDYTMDKFLFAINNDVDIESFVNSKFDVEISNGLLFMVACCLLYKNKKNDKSETGILNTIVNLISLSERYEQSNTDFSLLAVNFFASKLKNREVLQQELEKFNCSKKVKNLIGYL